MQRCLLVDGYPLHACRWMHNGASVDSYVDGSVDVSAGTELSITQKGAAYLKDNSRMKEVFWSSDKLTGNQTHKA